jgi:PKD repeat protein
MMKYVLTAMAFIFILLNPLSDARAASVKLSWLSNSEPDLEGYKVHYGISSKTYTKTIDVGNVTSYSLSILDSGTYYFALTAYDFSGNESGFSSEIPVVVSAPNQVPSASASANPLSGTAPLNISFSGTGNDKDGTVVSHLWSFGDGSQSTEQNPQHTYNNPGTYTATLTVTDNDGAAGSDSVTITVNDPPENPSDTGEDSDGDGIPDTLDIGPSGESLALDSDNDGLDNLIDGDYDNDGIPNDKDAYPFDTDNDGLDNAKDDDDDGDGIIDVVEIANGTDPLNPDTNGDGIKDSTNTLDSDGDGMIDDADPYPLIAQNDIDTDGDGIRDNVDIDADNDGIHNSLDHYPYDTDNDGWNNLDSDGIESSLSDNDDDGDGYSDDIDAFPLDTDNDGLHNGEDDDSDGDGVSDMFERIVGSDPQNPSDVPKVVRLSTDKIDPSSDGEVIYDYSGFSKYYEHTSVTFQYDADTLRYTVPPIVEVLEGDEAGFEELKKGYIPVGEVLKIHGGIVPDQTITFPLPIPGDYMGDKASIIVQVYNGTSWENVWTIASVSNDVVYVDMTHFSKWRLIGKKA